jgi:hypothetical protein
MKYTAIMFGIGSLICGLIAAWQWYRASKITIEPKFHELSEDVHESDFNWALVKAMLVAGQKTSALNRLAALWTAVAVLLGGATSLLATLAPH